MNTRQLSPFRTPTTPTKSFMPVRSGLLQRKCTCGGMPGPTGECEECRKKRLQRNLGNRQSTIENDSSVPSIVHEVLRSPGQPLDANARALMEPRFGHDFSQVRVHTDSNAAESARAVNALAYTVGRNVAFGVGRYQPTTNEGRKLLAHELTHVVQQQLVEPSPSSALRVGPADDLHEREAERVSATILQPTQDHLRLATGAGGMRLSSTFRRIQRAKGELFGALGGAVGGALIGGLAAGSVAGALIGGLVGAGIGALAGYLLGGGSKVKVDAGCKTFCPGLDIEQKANQADAKAASPIPVRFTYQVAGAPRTDIFEQEINLKNVVIKCDSSNTNCGGWSNTGVITLGKAACNAATCGDLASTLVHEMVHDWAGWGPPYDKKNVTVPGAAHTTPDFLDEWAARYVEKNAFSYDPWGLP